MTLSQAQKDELRVVLDDLFRNIKNIRYTEQRKDMYVCPLDDQHGGTRILDKRYFQRPDPSQYWQYLFKGREGQNVDLLNCYLIRWHIRQGECYIEIIYYHEDDNSHEQ
jgi:hypothetical protein